MTPKLQSSLPVRPRERRHVTIVAGFRSYQGIVLCADTQETVANISKRNVPKLIFQPSVYAIQTQAVHADELAVANEQLRIAEAAIDEEAAVVREARGRLAALVAPDILVSYERLREKLGGIGAAHLEGGACSGCHLQIPAGELHRLRHSAPDSVVYCDQCGRILIP